MLIILYLNYMFNTSILYIYPNIYSQLILRNGCQLVDEAIWCCNTHGHQEMAAGYVHGLRICLPFLCFIDSILFQKHCFPPSLLPVHFPFSPPMLYYYNSATVFLNSITASHNWGSLTLAMKSIVRGIHSAWNMPHNMGFYYAWWSLLWQGWAICKDKSFQPRGKTETQACLFPF